jgi:hypothetical protein
VSTSQSDAEPPRPAEGRPSVREAIELVALVVAPATLITALLFYFGWTRSRAQAAYFGINTDLLGRSSQEYMLRSIGSIFWPLILLLACLLFALLAHAGAKKLAARGRARLLFLLALVGIVVGAALIVLGVLGVVWSPRAGGGAVFTPTAFALGIPVFTYSVFVALSALSREPGKLPVLPRGAAIVVAGLFSVFVFWAIGNYADYRGRQLAARTAANLNQLPGVIIYSPHRLYLDGFGVKEEALSSSDASYRFRYSGLRLFARAGTRTFLLPSGWCRQDRDDRCEHDPVVFMLQDDDSIRLDFTP